MAEPKWKPIAAENLLDLIAEIAEEAPEAAKKLAAEIREKVNRLPAHPRLYKKCPQDSSLREMVIRRNHKVLYEIHENGDIEVINVIHSRQAWEKQEKD